MARNIKVIPSTVPLHAVGPVVMGAKRRVAAYARVSTDRDEQFTSYEAQIDYYTNYPRPVGAGNPAGRRRAHLYGAAFVHRVGILHLLRAL